MFKQIFKNRWFVWAIIVIVLTGFGVWGFAEYTKIEMERESAGGGTISKQNRETSILVPSEVEGWQTYRNEEYGFEFKYPVAKIKIQENSHFDDYGGNLFSLSFYPIDKDKHTTVSLNLGSLIYNNNNVPKSSHITQGMSLDEYKIWLKKNFRLSNASEDIHGWFCDYTKTKEMGVFDKKCLIEKPAGNFYQIDYIFDENILGYLSLDEFNQILSTFRFIPR